MKLNVLLATILVGNVCLSQNTSKTRTHYENVKVVYPALVKHLTKENTYQFVFPEKLAYYPSRRHMQMDGVLFPYSDMLLKAKSKDNPELYLVMEFQGITNLQSKGVRQTGDRYVIDITYNLPSKLVVQDNGKATLYSIDIFPPTETLTVAYTKNLSAYNTLAYSPVYFDTEKEATDFMNTSKDIGRYTERYGMLMAYRKIARMITELYNDHSERTYLQWFDIADPRGIAEYSELNAAADQVKQAYGLLGDGKNQEALPLFQSARQVFEKHSNSGNAVIDPVKKMIFFNLAWIGVSMGDAQAAATYYTKCESLPHANSRELAELKSLIDVLQFREGIKKAIGK